MVVQTLYTVHLLCLCSCPWKWGCGQGNKRLSGQSVHEMPDFYFYFTVHSILCRLGVRGVKYILNEIILILETFNLKILIPGAGVLKHGWRYSPFMWPVATWSPLALPEVFLASHEPTPSSNWHSYRQASPCIKCILLLIYQTAGLEGGGGMWAQSPPWRQGGNLRLTFLSATEDCPS